ncbi:MAG: Rossmann fold domain-containing protein [Pseudomonadota bacterium]
MSEGKHVECPAGAQALGLNPLEAHAAFMRDSLESVKSELEGDGVSSLTIVLPPATSEHDAWRRAIAGDLARAYTPKRVNIAAGAKGEALDTILTFLRDAPGVTGHYVQAHD